MKMSSTESKFLLKTTKDNSVGDLNFIMEKRDMIE
jgi:hypothetical protein